MLQTQTPRRKPRRTKLRPRRKRRLRKLQKLRPRLRRNLPPSKQRLGKIWKTARSAFRLTHFLPGEPGLLRRPRRSIERNSASSKRTGSTTCGGSTRRTSTSRRERGEPATGTGPERRDPVDWHALNLWKTCRDTCGGLDGVSQR